MRKRASKKFRDESLWTKISLLKETRKKLNMKKQETDCKTIDECINKLLNKNK